METQQHLVQELAWLRRVATGLVGDDGRAGDLTQEVALEALRRPPVVDGAALEGARLRGWLWTIARRKAGRGRERAALQAESEQRAARPDVSNGAARSAQQLGLHRDLLAEISALDADDASLITQRYLDQRPPREIAQAMGLPVTAVRKRLSRAMVRLRERLVNSDRGAEGWSLGLCLIVGSKAFPGPAGGGSGMAGGGGAPTFLGGSAAFKWAAFAMILVGVGAAAIWWAHAPETRSERVIERLALQKVEPINGTDLAPPVSTELDKSARGAVTSSEIAAAAQVEGDASLDGASILRVVDESGAPIGSARAVWADEGWTPRTLDVDSSGKAMLPAQALGFVYVGGEGFENQQVPIVWSGAGEMKVTLRRQRHIPGRLLIDGMAPGREVTLWQGRYSTNDWPSEIFGDERMKAALRKSGIAWTRGPIKTTADGDFVYTTNATWYDYFLTLPPEFRLVRSDGFYRAEVGRPTLGLMSDSEQLLIEVTNRECVTGQLVWEDSGQPLTGKFTTFPLDREGEWLGQASIFADADGRFSVPLRLVHRYDDGKDEPWQGLEVHVGEVEVTHSLDRPGQVHDLGTIEVPRARVAHFKILARGVGESVPLTAVVASDHEETLGSKSGKVSLPAAIGSTVRVFSEGYGYREVTVASQAAFESTPQVIELDPASRLRVRFELSERLGFDPNKSVKVVLRMRAFVFEGESQSEEDSEHFWRVYRELAGQTVQGFRSEGSEWGLGAGEAFFQGVPDKDLWVDGLKPGASFDVELQDMLGQVLMTEAVTMPLSAGTPVHSVEFGDVFGAGAAAVELTCIDPSSGEPYRGPLYIGHPVTGRVKAKYADGNGRLSLGPLVPGQYVFTEGSRGTPRKGEGVQVSLKSGVQQVTIQAIGRGTGQ